MWAHSLDRWGNLPYSLRIWGPSRPRIVYQRSDSPVGCYGSLGGWDKMTVFLWEMCAGVEWWDQRDLRTFKPWMCNYTSLSTKPVLNLYLNCTNPKTFLEEKNCSQTFGPHCIIFQFHAISIWKCKKEKHSASHQIMLLCGDINPIQGERERKKNRENADI